MMESGRADPVDPRIVVRGSTTGGTYHIYSLGSFMLTLDAATIASYHGHFHTGNNTDPTDNRFSLKFENDTGQTITQLVIQFAIADFFDTQHPDPYLEGASLVYEGAGQNGFSFLGAQVANGFVTWTFTGNVPPGGGGWCDDDAGYFVVKFLYFPQGMTANVNVSAPEPLSIGLLALGLGFLGLGVRRLRT